MNTTDLQSYLRLALDRNEAYKEARRKQRIWQAQSYSTQNIPYLGRDPNNPCIRPGAITLINALKKEIRYRVGYEDRKNGMPCMVNDGVYLNGFYGDGTLQYVTYEELRELHNTQ